MILNPRLYLITDVIHTSSNGPAIVGFARPVDDEVWPNQVKASNNESNESDREHVEHLEHNVVINVEHMRQVLDATEIADEAILCPWGKP